MYSSRPWFLGKGTIRTNELRGKTWNVWQYFKSPSLISFGIKFQLRTFYKSLKLELKAEFLQILNPFFKKWTQWQTNNKILERKTIAFFVQTQLFIDHGQNLLQSLIKSSSLRDWQFYTVCPSIFDILWQSRRIFKQ